MNSSARNVKSIVSCSLRNDAVPNEMFRDFDNWIADHEQTNLDKHFQSSFRHRILSPSNLIHDDLR